jgi:phosphinothricin acetyltransferase
MIVRPATLDDAPACAAIYAHHVLHGFGTFEEQPPAAEDMAARMDKVLAQGFPWVVAAEEDRVLAFAYAAPFRERSAYRYTAEDSVYVAEDALGKGHGRAVLTAVVALCEAKGLRRLIAAIGDSGNEASVALHRALGFEPCGVLPAVGYKHGRWLDVALMQLPLNGGDETTP